MTLGPIATGPFIQNQPEVGLFSLKGPGNGAVYVKSAPREELAGRAILRDFRLLEFHEARHCGIGRSHGRKRLVFCLAGPISRRARLP